MRTPHRKDKFWFCLKQVIRAEKVISHAGPTVKLCFALLWGGRVCAKFIKILASKAIRKAAGAAPRHGAVGRAEQGGLLCCQRLQAPAAFRGVSGLLVLLLILVWEVFVSAPFPCD